MKDLATRPKIAFIIGLLVIILIVSALFSIDEQTDKQTLANKNELQTLASSKPISTHYICPMHSHIVSDKAGTCPICGMDLVINKAQSSIAKTSDQSVLDTKSESTNHKVLFQEKFPAVKIDPRVVNNLGVRTALVYRGELQRHIETLGKITRVDPMARQRITPPVKGTIVYLADKTQGDTIAQGELLFAIKSPELEKMQQAYQLAYQQGKNNIATPMLPALRKAGMSPEQIAQLQKGSRTDLPAEVRASEAGFVYARRGKVGEQVNKGFTMFNLGGDYQVIEVTAEIFERQWPFIEEQQSAIMQVRGLPGKRFKGKVTRVEPPVGYTTRSLEIRLKFKTNHPGLSQSMFARITIQGNTRKNLLLVPSEAIIRTGEGQRVVTMDHKGYFLPVAVVAGEEANNITEIISGLNEGDKIVVSGQFLIDSESQLSAGFSRMSN